MSLLKRKNEHVENEGSDNGSKPSSKQLKTLDTSEEKHEEEVVCVSMLTCVCIECNKPMISKGGIPIVSPGCCGSQYHQSCLVNRSACPKCNKLFPVDFMPPPRPLSSIPSRLLPKSSVPLKVGVFPSSFHVDNNWELALKNKSSIWSNCESSFAACINYRGQIAHHTYTKRDITCLVKSRPAKWFRSLAYPMGRGVSAHDIHLSRVNAIKKEISNYGPVISLSFTPATGAADENDLPIIVGWATCTTVHTVYDVWITRNRSTGERESHVPFGSSKIDDNIAIPNEDVNNMRWHHGAYFCLGDNQESQPDEEWKSWTGFGSIISLQNFAYFWGDLNSRSANYTASDLTAMKPTFEVYAGKKKADCKRAYLTSIQLESDGFLKILATYC